MFTYGYVPILLRKQNQLISYISLMNSCEYNKFILKIRNTEVKMMDWSNFFEFLLNLKVESKVK